MELLVKSLNEQDNLPIDASRMESLDDVGRESSVLDADIKRGGDNMTVITKQEEIKKGLIKFFTPPNTTLKGEPILKENIEGVVTSLLEYLDSQGVVIKAGGISDNLAQTADGIGVSGERSSCVFKDAGYVAVEPLII